MRKHHEGIRWWILAATYLKNPAGMHAHEQEHTILHKNVPTQVLPMLPASLICPLHTLMMSLC